jgi:hypothetical protein
LHLAVSLEFVHHSCNRTDLLHGTHGRTCYIEPMNEHNLADPDFEPTDEQLQELMKSAFANVKADHEAGMDRLRLEIEQASAVALERVSKLLAES